MPLQNRVAPDGAFLATPARGLFMGNRGVLHDEQGRLTAARWRHRAWVCCLTAFNGRRRPLMQPRRYTELFFLDEATALAAGHRPCGECRRADYAAFMALWREVHGAAGVKAVDAALHAARAEPGARRLRRWEARLEALPDGVFVAAHDGPALVLGDALRPWSPSGYGPPRRRGTGRATVLTPAPTAALLAAGWRPRLHPSIGAGGAG